MKRQGLLSVTGILLLGLIVLMTLHEWGNPLDPAQREAFLNAPVIIAKGVEAESFTDTGKLQYHLDADHLEQFDRTSKTLLTNPHLRVNNDKGVWTISSKHGEVLDSGGLILFKNDVQAHNAARKLTLKTDELRYHSNTDIVEAPSSVKMTFQKGSTQAGSLHGNLKTGKMQLKQGVVSDFNGLKQ